MSWIRVPDHNISLVSNRVKIWFGCFKNEAECKEFFKREIWSGKGPVDNFAACQNTIMYIPDHLHCYFDAKTDLRNFFWRGVNVNKNSIPDIIKTVKQYDTTSMNCIIIYPTPDWFDNEGDNHRLSIPDAKSVEGKNFKIYYVGEYPSADDLLWEDNERAHQWVGYFPSEKRFLKFMEETYNDDDEVPLSEFAASQGTTWYDHDWLEFSYEPEKSIEQYLNGADWKYGDGEAERLIKLATDTHMKKINTYITFYEYSKNVRDEGCPGQNSFKGKDFELIYLGRYKPHQVLL